jgi:ferritin-like metal-binding protein YciE
VIQTPQDLLVYALQEIQDAEAQASQAVQNQLRLIENEELGKLLERRLEQGGRLLRDVSQALRALGGQGRGDPNTAARGLIEQAERVVELAQTPELKQVALIAGVQKLEHYCIAAWGTVRSLANEVGQQDLARAMQRALDEGHALDRELSNLAEGWVNPTAIEQADLAQDGEA